MRDGKIVFDGPASDLSAAVARDVYGADKEFSEAATSTSIETLETVDRAVLKTA
jgi:phosphonate transport system ATP-binding protein